MNVFAHLVMQRSSAGGVTRANHVIGTVEFPNRSFVTRADVLEEMKRLLAEEDRDVAENGIILTFTAEPVHVAEQQGPPFPGDAPKAENRLVETLKELHSEVRDRVEPGVMRGAVLEMIQARIEALGG